MALNKNIKYYIIYKEGYKNGFTKISQMKIYMYIYSEVQNFLKTYLQRSEGDAFRITMQKGLNTTGPYNVLQGAP